VRQLGRQAATEAVGAAHQPGRQAAIEVVLLGAAHQLGRQAATEAVLLGVQHLQEAAHLAAEAGRLDNVNFKTHEI
jgi:hypothetical protein